MLSVTPAHLCGVGLTPTSWPARTDASAIASELSCTDATSPNFAIGLARTRCNLRNYSYCQASSFQKSQVTTSQEA